jgi:hypothetical protein
LKKCQEKLKKHSQSKFHAEATEKVLLFDDSRSDPGDLDTRKSTGTSCQIEIHFMIKTTEYLL